jgi:hypothetical protein
MGADVGRFLCANLVLFKYLLRVESILEHATYESLLCGNHEASGVGLHWRSGNGTLRWRNSNGFAFGAGIAAGIRIGRVPERRLNVARYLQSNKI